MIEVELQGDKRLIKKLVAGVYLAPLHKLIRTVTLLGERYAREGVVKDTAGLARSIESEAKGLNGRVFSLAAHALPVEFGRRAGARMPPTSRDGRPGPLVGWLRRHGIPIEAEFVVARAIARRGIKGRFFMRKAHQRLRNELPTLIGRTKREIERLWGRS